MNQESKVWEVEERERINHPFRLTYSEADTGIILSTIGLFYHIVSALNAAKAFAARNGLEVLKVEQIEK